MTGLSLKTLKKPDQNELRDEVVVQLRESLAMSRKNMFDQDLSLLERQHWAQVHTNTAQVLNTILRDQQFRDWEKRMKLLEKNGAILSGETFR